MNKVLYKFHFDFYKFFLYLIAGIVAIAVSLTIHNRYSKTNSIGIFKVIDEIMMFTWAIPMVLAILSYIYVIIFIVEYIKVKKLQLKEYKMVEGTVQNFFSSSMFKSESFDINGVEFKYNSKYLLNGYCKIKSSGGIITGNGQNLKIFYYQKKNRNLIIYIEEIR